MACFIVRLLSTGKKVSNQGQKERALHAPYTDMRVVLHLFGIELLLRIHFFLIPVGKTTSSPDLVYSRTKLGKDLYRI